MTISLEDVSTAEAIEVPTQLGELLSDEEADRLREDLMGVWIFLFGLGVGVGGCWPSRRSVNTASA